MDTRLFMRVTMKIPLTLKKAAIDICIEGGFATWTVDIDCIKCIAM